VVTSANALRGIKSRLKSHRLLELPLFAVGDHTADAARNAGFTCVISANGDGTSLRDCVLASVRAKRLQKASTLLYLAGADRAGGDAMLHLQQRRRGPPRSRSQPGRGGGDAG